MTKKTMTCPACGSTQLERFEIKSLGRLTLGPEFFFDEIYFKCSSCSQEGDFLGETDRNYLSAEKNAEFNFVKRAIKELGDAGISMAFFERVFELPTRTLTRWKNGDFSSSALALLRLVKTYHWLVEVAEHRFDPKFAKQAVITVVVNTEKPFIEMQSGNSSYDTYVFNSESSGFVERNHGLSCWFSGG